VLWVLCVVR